jgi:hypothetical protein
MNNSNSASEQILEYLLKTGWVSTNCYSSQHVRADIEQMIINDGGWFAQDEEYCFFVENDGSNWCYVPEPESR